MLIQPGALRLPAGSRQRWYGCLPSASWIAALFSQLEAWISSWAIAVACFMGDYLSVVIPLYPVAKVQK
jgi:uncharacterized protein YraI